MNEIMRVGDIRKKFNNHWILIDQPETDEQHEILSGRVVCASENRDDVYAAALTLPEPRHIAVECTQPMPARVWVSAWR